MGYDFDSHAGEAYEYAGINLGRLRPEATYMTSIMLTLYIEALVIVRMQFYQVRAVPKEPATEIPGEVHTAICDDCYFCWISLPIQIET